VLQHSGRYLGGTTTASTIVDRIKEAAARSAIGPQAS